MACTYQPAPFERRRGMIGRNISCLLPLYLFDLAENRGGNSCVERKERLGRAIGIDRVKHDRPRIVPARDVNRPLTVVIVRFGQVLPRNAA